MKNLFESYSVSEIIIFVITLAFAIKEFVTFFDWCKGRVRTAYDKNHESVERNKELQNELDNLNKLFDDRQKIDDTFAKIDCTFEKINDRINMLIESDKEGIKSYITEKHHFFVYVQEWIDDYSMECLERRFSVYKQEHGNSFVEGLMNEIRALPKQPPEMDEHKYSNTAEYVKSAKSKH